MLATHAPREAHPIARLARRAMGLVAIAVVVVGMVASGTTYWWCSAMQKAHAAACCCCGVDAPESDPASLRRADCCEPVSVGDLPASGASDPSPRLAGAWHASAPRPGLEFTTPRTLRAPSPATARSMRTERAPPPQAARRALLQVFHC